MQKNMVKAVGTFMLVLFVMSVTGAAACNGSTCSANTITAKADIFSFSPCKKCGNVLSNDKGKDLKVTTTGNIKTAKGSKVYVKSNGYFCYYAKAGSKSIITDTFTYKVKDKYGKTATAKVTIKYDCKC